MKGLWLEDRQLRLRDDLVPPAAAPGEATIRVLRAGICRTDLELVRGYYPFTGVPGHEFVGEVLAGPEGLVGQRVVGEINAVCGRCATCRAGRPTHCETRTVLGIVGRDGAFAELLALPVENLHVVPENVSLDQATFVEPLAAAFEIEQQIALRPEERVLVVGDGKLGQLIARALVLSGCELWVLGRHPAKLERLAPLGITTAAREDAVSGSFDVAIECTGNAQGFELAVRRVRPRGTLVMKSTYAGRLTLDAAHLVVNEISLVGSRCGPFAPALRALASGRVRVNDLVEAHYPLGRALEAFEHAGRRGALKVLLEPD